MILYQLAILVFEWATIHQGEEGTWDVCALPHPNTVGVFIGSVRVVFEFSNSHRAKLDRVKFHGLRFRSSSYVY